MDLVGEGQPNEEAWLGEGSPNLSPCISVGTSTGQRSALKTGKHSKSEPREGSGSA